MTTLTHTPATEGQIEQLSRVASDAAKKAVRDYNNFSKKGAQRVHERGAELAVRVREATILALTELSTTDQYTDEEVPWNYGYPSGYAKPWSIAVQTNALRRLFPGVEFADEKIAKSEPPEGAEGWFAIPKWQSLAPTYVGAVQMVLDAIKKQRKGKFYNDREGQIRPELLRQTVKTTAASRSFAVEQKDHDILVVPAQFGIRHRGRSVRRAREVFSSNEFGLGAFAVGIMLLTHPERLQHYDDLWIDCAGDEFDDPRRDDCFSEAPHFCFHDGEVWFSTHWLDDASGYCGSASGLLPQ